MTISHDNLHSANPEFPGSGLPPGAGKYTRVVSIIVATILSRLTSVYQLLIFSVSD